MTEPGAAADCEARWLDDGEQRAWRAFRGVSMLLPGALDQQLQRDSALTHSSYIVLAMLSEAYKAAGISLGEV